MSELTTLPDGAYSEMGQIALVAEGIKYLLANVEEKHLDLCEEHLRTNQKPAVQALSDIIPQLTKADPEVREYMMNRAWQDVRANEKVAKLSRQAVKDWLDTEEGGAFMLFHQMLPTTPDITLEKAKQVLRKVGLAQALQARDRAAARLISTAEALREAQQPRS
jgi:hypothetical protein